MLPRFQKARNKKGGLASARVLFQKKRERERERVEIGWKSNLLGLLSASAAASKLLGWLVEPGANASLPSLVEVSVGDDVVVSHHVCATQTRFEEREREREVKER